MDSQYSSVFASYVHAGPKKSDLASGASSHFEDIADLRTCSPNYLEASALRLYQLSPFSRSTSLFCDYPCLISTRETTRAVFQIISTVNHITPITQQRTRELLTLELVWLNTMSIIIFIPLVCIASQSFFQVFISPKRGLISL